MAKVLIGCEQSGTVRDAFLAQGHDAWSCDLLPSETPSNRHIQDDVRNVLKFEKWDFLAILHPPCVRLCNSGVRWLSTPPPGRTNDEMWDELRQGAEFFSDMMEADVPHKAIENPVMHKHAKALIRNYRPFSQTIQPWQFATSDDSADNIKKRTCLWLDDLPVLRATGTLDGTTARDEIHKASPGPNRWKERSRFFPGIADQMAIQWGNYTNAQLQLI